MKLDLTEIAKTIGMHAEATIDEPCPPDMGLECESNVHGKVKLTNTGTLLVLSGEVIADVKLECGRCLVDFAAPLKAEIEEQFRLEHVGDAVGVFPLEEEDENTLLVNNNLLDVDELIRQNLLLVLPIRPLCDEDCAGLCPTCGENLNTAKCECPPPKVDSPFSVLADLLDDETEA